MRLSKEDVRSALVKAYEAGWYGCLELKDQYVNELLKDLSEKALTEDSVPLPETTTTFSMDANVIVNVVGEDELRSSWAIYTA